MMDKQAVIREDVTPPEDNAEQVKKASAEQLENHVTTRLQQQVEKQSPPGCRNQCGCSRKQ